MQRRGRSIDRSYAHRNLLKPLRRSYWEQDVVTQETREAAALPETPVEIILPPAPEPASAPTPALTKKRRPKSAKPTPPTRFRLKFSPSGECLGFIDVEETTESEKEKCL